MKITAQAPLKVVPGQFMVVWRGHAASAHLVTRVLPNRYFHRYVVNGVSRESFALPAEVIGRAVKRENAETYAKMVNEAADAYRAKERAAWSELNGAVETLGLLLSRE